MTAATPIVLMAGGLPITPAGLGTQQALLVLFLAPWAPEAKLLAFGFVFPIAILLVRLPLGLLYLSDLRALRAASSDPPQEESSAA